MLQVVSVRHPLTEPLEKRVLLAGVSSMLDQAIAGPADVLTATFKKNAPTTASSLSFSRLGRYATHAISKSAADLARIAEQSGVTTTSLFSKGLRESWWMGQRTQTMAGEWIVRFDDFSGNARKQFNAAKTLVAGKLSGVSVERFTYLDGAFLIKAPESTSYRTLATTLSTIQGFSYIEPNFAIAAPAAIPNDSTYSSQWAWPKINAPGAWDVTTGSSDIVVAVLDTGTQVSHPDLAANIFVNTRETPGNGIDDDGNGYIDDVKGWNFGHNTATVDNGDHGTHVSGTIGAVGNNGVGVTGFSWSVKVLPLDIFPDNYTNSSLYIAALGYLNALKQQGVNVVASNNSYGSLGSTSQSVKDAIKVNAAHNILFVAAAGNDGQNVSSTGFSPATNGEPNSIAVAATNSSDGRPSWSNWGSNVHIAAPGETIRSTTPSGGYGNKSGTSMASPHVAGLVGLTYSVVPNASYHQIKQAIVDGGDAINWASTPLANNKRINAANTINLVRTHASGKLYLDTNRDGVQQALESMLSGWRVYNDTNNNGSRDANEAYATVQLNGQYDLILTAGDQRIRLEPTAGYATTLGAAGYVFNLAQFASIDAIDFAVAPATLGAVGGVVFADTDGNGLQDPGETPLGGTAVYLDRNNDGVLDPAGSFVSPDAPRALAPYITATSGLAIARSGSISDVNVKIDIAHTTLSQLRVTLIHPDGTRIRLADANGSSGDNFSGTVFDSSASQSISQGSAPFAGTYRPVDSLSGLNGKSIAGGWQLEVRNNSSFESGTLNGWSLSFNNDVGDAVQFTNADGTYRFDNLAAGTHRVRVVPRSGFTVIAPVGGLQSQTLLAGEVIEGRDFSLQPTSAFDAASISGKLWYDAQGNGVADVNDYGLSGWIAYIDANNNDQLDLGETTSITDEQGAYRFDGLLPGTHTVRTLPLPGYSTVSPLLGEYAVNVVGGQNAAGGDFFFVRRSISGMVFVDLDADGVKDSGETTGISGRTVYIDGNDNGSLDLGELQAVTSSGGVYSFNGVSAGVHVVRLILTSTGYTLSHPVAGFNTADVTTAVSVTNKNFGAWTGGWIVGTVYTDNDLSGVKDTGEAALSGRTVYLDANNNSALDVGETSTTTDSSGFYSFSSIKPGTHRVRLFVPSPYLGVKTLQSAVLTSGQYLSGQDLTVANPASLNYRSADYASSPNTGWNWAYYEHAGSLTTVAALDPLTPVRTGTTATTGTAPVVNIGTPFPRADSFGIIWSGYVAIPTDGIYTFYTTSDDGSTLSIGDTLVVDNDGAHGSQERSGLTALRSGLHEITVKYFENTSGQAITVSWEGMGINKGLIPSSAAFLAPPPPDATLPTVQISPIVPANRAAPVDSVTVTFSEPVSGFDLADLSLVRNGQSAVMSGVNISTTDNIVYTVSGLTNLTRIAGAYTLSVNASGSGIVDLASNALATSSSQSWNNFATIAGRHVFYNNSYYDGKNPLANSADDAAIAPDKSALVSGTATFANYTSYTAGINGVMVDIANAGDTLTLSDFGFATVTGLQGGTTPLAVLPTMSVRTGAGVGGSDRVTFVWPDGTIRNTWLKVTVFNTVATGLQSPDIFYFGNVIAETGGVAGSTVVDSFDVTRVRANLSGRFNPPSIDSLFDINRDHVVDSFDVTVVRANLSSRTPVPLITV